ncbi:MAG: proton-conducting transporter membrane subunit [Bacteroidia bacterium]|nr:proton-conducting transporter membrane subunit [Bacteroidia bacterium]
MLGLYFIISVILAILSFLNRNKALQMILLSLFLVVQAGITAYGYTHLHSEALGYFTYDATGIIFLSVLSLLSLSTVYHSYMYLKHTLADNRKQSIYYAALIGLIASMSGAYLASHLGVMWICIETTTLCVSVLIYHERTHLALEAAWKYVFICSIGIALAFVGIIFLSAAIRENGSVNLSFASIPKHLVKVNVLWLKLAFLFMLVGFSTKMGLFPMHPICVDAHTVAPPPISAFISTTLMNVGFVAIFRTYSLLAATPVHPWMNQILLWCGLLSVFVSAIYLLKVQHLKRMSAYSSLEHMGLSAIGLACGGLGYFAAIFHLVLHSFTKASIFYQVDQIHRTYNSYLVSETGNYFQRNLPGAIVILFAFTGITAIPPSGLFITEFWLMKSMYSSAHLFMLILTVIFLSFAMYGLGKNIFSLLFSRPEKVVPATGLKIPFIESVPQYFLLALVIYLGINPPVQFTNLISEAVKFLP